MCLRFADVKAIHTWYCSDVLVRITRCVGVGCCEQFLSKLFSTRVHMNINTSTNVSTRISFLNLLNLIFLRPDVRRTLVYWILESVIACHGLCNISSHFKEKVHNK